MNATDLSLVVTVHNESIVSGPTMRSAELAIRAARVCGFTVQAIIALDAATKETTQYFHQERFDHWERWIMDEGDVGRVRNAVIPQTSGRLIAFLDADDLFSENWLAEGIARLRQVDATEERLIAHPELNVLFDGFKFVLRSIDQAHPLFTPFMFYVRNYYDSLCMAPREAHLEHPYPPRDIPNGFSREDWQFAVETMASGWRHVIVPDTIIFKRRREGSLVQESDRRRSIIRALPEMAIDRINDLASLNGLGHRGKGADRTPGQ